MGVLVVFNVNLDGKMVDIGEVVMEFLEGMKDMGASYTKQYEKERGTAYVLRGPDGERGEVWYQITGWGAEITYKIPWLGIYDKVTYRKNGEINTSRDMTYSAFLRDEKYGSEIDPIDTKDALGAMLRNKGMEWDEINRIIREVLY
ncbi:MAG: hypothetical protein DRP11_02065 [Candidatus Aenigmatarchaeota archaeon]|nr:MAG: hypothetical protein DRP11_02065 [Candidatus Aenigmarchaeota archaeon]